MNYYNTILSVLWRCWCDKRNGFWPAKMWQACLNIDRSRLQTTWQGPLYRGNSASDMHFSQVNGNLRLFKVIHFWVSEMQMLDHIFSYNNFGLSLKVWKVKLPKALKESPFSTTALSFDSPSSDNPHELLINLTLLETRVPDLHFYCQLIMF